MHPKDVRWRLDHEVRRLAASSAPCSPLVRALDALADAAALAVDLTLPVIRASGVVHGEPLAVIAAGSEPWSLYLVERALADDYHVERLGRAAALNLPRLLPRWEAEADIVILRLGRLLSRFVSHRYFPLPEWVDFSYPLRPFTPPEEIRSKSLKHNLSTVRKGRTSARRTRDPRDIDFFYRRMYRPTLLARYGSRAKVFSPSIVSAVARTGVLLLVDLDGRPAGGVALDRRGRVLRATFLGVLDADPRLYKLHVPAAIYYHAIMEGHKAGCDEVNFGGSRPVLSDGLTFHKLRWNMTPRTRDSNYFMLNLRICSNTGATRRFLALNPFVFERSGALHSLGCRLPDGGVGRAQAGRASGIDVDGSRIVIDLAQGGGVDGVPAGVSRIVARAPDLLDALDEARQIAAAR